MFISLNMCFVVIRSQSVCLEPIVLLSKKPSGAWVCWRRSWVPMLFLAEGQYTEVVYPNTAAAANSNRFPDERSPLLVWRNSPASLSPTQAFSPRSLQTWSMLSSRAAVQRGAGIFGCERLPTLIWMVQGMLGLLQVWSNAMRVDRSFRKLISLHSFPSSREKVP